MKMTNRFVSTIACFWKCNEFPLSIFHVYVDMIVTKYFVFCFARNQKLFIQDISQARLSKLFLQIFADVVVTFTADAVGTREDINKYLILVFIAKL